METLDMERPVLKKKKENGITVIFIIFVSLIVIEVGLRVGLGFCNAVLYREDPDFEYIAIPQKTKRFGNNVFYNSFSQRNGEITSQDSIIIIGFGDSILNGGTLLDDDSLATTKLSKYLTHKINKKVKVLNIASQSWGPDNCYAYLKKYGSFNAKGMFLVMSSHDAFDNINFEKVVGTSPNYPAKQYPLAIIELVDKYLIPKIESLYQTPTSDNGNGINKKTPNSSFNSGILNLFKYAQNNNLPFVIYLHADTEELENKQYSEDGRLVESFCQAHGIPLIKELDYHLLSKNSYRDGIHLSDLGQEELFELLKDKVYSNPN